MVYIIQFWTKARILFVEVSRAVKNGHSCCRKMMQMHSEDTCVAHKAQDWWTYVMRQQQARHANRSSSTVIKLESPFWDKLKVVCEVQNAGLTAKISSRAYNPHLTSCSKHHKEIIWTDMVAELSSALEMNWKGDGAMRMKLIRLTRILLATLHSKSESCSPKAKGPMNTIKLSIVNPTKTPDITNPYYSSYEQQVSTNWIKQLWRKHSKYFKNII